MAMTFVPPQPIDTDRLIVRTVAERDLPDLLVVNGDDLVTRYLPYETWTSLAQAQAWLERMTLAQNAGTALQWVVLEKASGTVVAACVLFQYDGPSARAELGYVLGRPWWGRGYMQEALTALLACGFATLGLRRIEAEVDPRNLASSALLKRLGFQSEGVLRGRWVNKGVVCDVESFGLLSHEWREPITAPRLRGKSARNPHGTSTASYQKDS